MGPVHHMRLPLPSHNIASAGRRLRSTSGLFALHLHTRTAALLHLCCAHALRLPARSRCAARARAFRARTACALLYALRAAAAPLPLPVRCLCLPLRRCAAACRAAHLPARAARRARACARARCATPLLPRLPLPPRHSRRCRARAILLPATYCSAPRAASMTSCHLHTHIRRTYRAAVPPLLVCRILRFAHVFARACACLTLWLPLLCR